MSTSVKNVSLDQTAVLSDEGREKRSFRQTMSNALIITSREMRDSLRDWRIMAPILILTFLFPFLAQFVAGQLSTFVEGYGAEVIGTRLVPFLLMIVGFFPISISLVIALETFVGEKERRSLEPLLSTPLTNTELYIGKTLAAMLPPLISSFGGMALYLLGLLFGEVQWRPHPALVAQIILLTAVQALVMVTGSVVVSSQTTSTRAANLLASFIIIPMTLVIQLESVIMFLAEDAESPNGVGALWAIIIGMFAVVLLLLRLGNSIFNREELLGRSLDALNFRNMLRRLWRTVRAVDDQAEPVKNVWEWYRIVIPASLRRLKSAVILTVIAFIIVTIGGVIVGLRPEWHLNIPTDTDLSNIEGNFSIISEAMFGRSAVFGIFMQNLRILLLAGILSTFTFGAMALILTPAVYFILGYLFTQLSLSGHNIWVFVPAFMTHGIVEIPMIVLATACALRVGAVVTRPPKGRTVGSAWTVAFTDAVKLWIGIILPGLLVAAIIEAYITPLVMVALLNR